MGTFTFREANDGTEEGMGRSGSRSKLASLPSSSINTRRTSRRLAEHTVSAKKGQKHVGIENSDPNHEKGPTPLGGLKRSAGLFNLEQASRGEPRNNHSIDLSSPSTTLVNDEAPLKRPYPGSTEDLHNHSARVNMVPDSLSYPNVFYNGGVEMKRQDSVDDSAFLGSTLSPERSYFDVAANHFSASHGRNANASKIYSPSPSPSRPGHHPFANNVSFNARVQSSPKVRPKPKFNSSVAVEVSKGDVKGGSNTPDYKFVKPLQTAFMSTGLLSKRNRIRTLSSGNNVADHTGNWDESSPESNFSTHSAPPDTPCKRPVTLMSSTPSVNAAADASKQNASLRQQSRLGLRNSLLRFSFGDSDNSDSVMYDVPETPTKEHSAEVADSQPFGDHLVDDLAPPPAMRQVSDASTVTMGKFSSSGPSSPNSSLASNLSFVRVATANQAAIAAGRQDTIEAAVDNNSNQMKRLSISKWSEESPTPQTPDLIMHEEPQLTLSLEGADQNSFSEAILAAQADYHEGSSDSSENDARKGKEPPRTPAKGLVNTGSSGFKPFGLHDSGYNFSEIPHHSLAGNDSVAANFGNTSVTASTANAMAPRLVTPFFNHSIQSSDSSLYSDPILIDRFEKVSVIGRGEFSIVYSVTVHEAEMAGGGDKGDNQSVYAVKRTKYPFMGQKARQRKLEEVEILRDLCTPHSDDGEIEEIGREHVMNMIDAWEASGHLYIMTEYCENGSLDVFLSERGNVSRLDEWRVWKILVEITLGLRHVHNSGFLHLDIKPANIFITFEGTLKIGDFGMATRYPAPEGIEREGDREYIAPEILSSQRYDKQADIFSLGIMMLEIAANIVLPDNGVHWQKLRSGDLTDAGRLSSGDLNAENHESSGSSDLGVDDDAMLITATSPSASIPTASLPSHGSGTSQRQNSQQLHPHALPPYQQQQRRRRFGVVVPPWAPKFMVDNSAALDNIVKWMLDPEPTKRPTVQDILDTFEVSWVESHRRAGAVIYEGDFGPDTGLSIDDNGANEMLQDEVTDWRRQM